MSEAAPDVPALRPLTEADLPRLAELEEAGKAHHGRRPVQPERIPAHPGDT